VPIRSDLERAEEAASVLLAEAARRAHGEPSDPRLNVPLAVLLDLSEEIESWE